MDSYEALIITAGGVIVAVLGICCKSCYKIKISELSVCWNALVVKRDVEDERRIDLENPEHQSMTSSSKTRRDEIPSRI